MKYVVKHKNLRDVFFIRVLNHVSEVKSFERYFSFETNIVGSIKGRKKFFKQCIVLRVLQCREEKN